MPVADSVMPLVAQNEEILDSHTSSNMRFRPEESPFQTLIVDITHRCNMQCRNCYIPNRTIPDMNADFLYDVLARLPHRTRVRLVGAEPTMRADLPDMISRVRKLGHIPFLLSNGLKLSRREYLQQLKDAGLRFLYLSMNGGVDDAMYLEIDEMACAQKKLAALDNACALHLYTELGMILVRDLNTPQIGALYHHVKGRRQIRELNFRSVGPMGRYIDREPYSLDELEALFFEHTGLSRDQVDKYHRHDYHSTFTVGRLQIQFTQWPDLGSHRRGRLTPDGYLEPFFEHVMANEGGY